MGQWINLLISIDISFQMSPSEQGEKLTQLARQGKLNKIKNYFLAGANLNSTNIIKQTPLHAAVEAGQKMVFS